MTDAAPSRPARFWNRPLNNQPAHALAAMRTGAGREPGSIPQMWPYYTTLTDNGSLTRKLVAEHATLGLYAIHQQSIGQPMHQPGRRIGQALAILRHNGRYSPDAIERRVGQAATADDVAEVTHHLRSLIDMLKPDRIGFDYDELCSDLEHWQYADRLPRVRRRWGADFYSSTKSTDTDTTVAEPEEVTR